MIFLGIGTAVAGTTVISERIAAAEALAAEETYIAYIVEANQLATDFNTLDLEDEDSLRTLAESFEDLKERMRSDEERLRGASSIIDEEFAGAYEHINQNMLFALGHLEVLESFEVIDGHFYE